MGTLFYLEINLFCVCLLFLMVHRLNSHVVQRENSLFSGVVVQTIILFGLDFFWRLLDGADFPFSIWLNRIVNALFYIQTGALTFSWFYYSESLRDTVLFKNRKALVIAMLPLILLVLTSVSSIFTGWIFYVDDCLKYHRGPYYWIHVVVEFIYMVYAASKVMVAAFMKKYYAQRRIFLTLSFSSIFMMAGFYLQAIFSGIPVFCAGATLALLAPYFSLQNHLISEEPLTRLNNYKQLNRHLQTGLKTRMEGEPLYLIVIEVLDLKQVRQIFGRDEGDNAILIVAEFLKRICAPRGVFIAKRAFDNFALVGNFESLEPVQEICSEIKKATLKASGNLPYPLHVEIGYGVADSSIDNIPDFLEKAKSNPFVEA